MNDYWWVEPALTLITIVITSAGVIFVLRQRVTDITENLGEIKLNVNTRMEKMEANLDKLTAVSVVQARHDERLSAMDQRLILQGARVDEFMRQQVESHDRMARMVEATVSRVNELADRGFRAAG